MSPLRLTRRGEIVRDILQILGCMLFIVAAPAFLGVLDVVA